MNRQPGYYWVRYEGEWEIAQYSPHKLENNIHYLWSLPAIIYEGWWHTDDDFDEIDERRIERSDKDVIDVIKANYPKEDLPKIILTNPYICKPDES